ncbi:hypothetical protein [Fuerstiella marisgermanici]|uniref:Uncharacterized protein n=1 Tax=Fuerstiella marisgermanici TaxID=1891926 RepID=A0A1P8WDD6_9PLAN|nr:hypothetical protein [Fuerstiella marisgermanici]APZ92054.1 hypothetical protein Fuma_01658 [Fuerstiella marisgermanici]
MAKVASTLTIIGVVCLGVGLLGLLSKLLALANVDFTFVVSPWYGPFFAGIVLSLAGWMMRSKQKPAAANGEPRE